MSNQDGIRAYIKPAVIERFAKYMPVKMGQSVNDFFSEFMDLFESGRLAEPVKTQESRKK